MVITIAKDAGAGSGSDTTYTIRNFRNLSIDGATPAESFDDMTGDEQDTVIIKILGAKMTVDFDWTILDESTSVVSGAGGTVTTALQQQTYLYDTLMSQGTSAILDWYQLTLDYGGGNTWARFGVIAKLDLTMTSDAPLTFNGHISFVIGTVA